MSTQANKHSRLREAFPEHGDTRVEYERFRTAGPVQGRVTGRIPCRGVVSEGGS